MDPITAFGNVVVAITKLVTVIAEGQTPEQRKILWDIYIKDLLWWRKALGIDKE